MSFIYKKNFRIQPTQKMNSPSGTLVRLRLSRLREPAGGHCIRSHRTLRRQEIEIQTVLVLVVITIMFLVSWLPLDVSYGSKFGRNDW